eukprot:9366731-Pyramimonas_sp.AAC.1
MASISDIVETADLLQIAAAQGVGKSPPMRRPAWLATGVHGALDVCDTDQSIQQRCRGELK